MNKDLTPYDEQYHRVDIDTARLLKDAGFNLVCYAMYLEEDNSFQHNEEGCENSNETEYDFYYSTAPLIDVVLFWLGELGYKYEQLDYILAVIGTKEFGGTFNVKSFDTYEESFPRNQRDFNLLFISTCLQHIIETQNKQ